MNVFLNTQTGLSKAMLRVVTKLIRYAPSDINVVDNVEDADLVVLHVIGYPETLESINRIKAMGKKYAMIQYCLRTTQRPNTADWIPLWKDAVLVWSYYDLAVLCAKDGQTFPEEPLFLYAPLGVDTGVFNKGLSSGKFPYKILTTGTLAGPESVDSVNAACQELGEVHAHVGLLHDKSEKFSDSSVEFFNEVSDARLAQLYRQSQFVSGLRKVEGFELPAAEGLISGARPILFNKHHYRKWFDDLGAVFIEEGTPEEITAQLKTILGRPSNYWEELNIEVAKKRFSWANICTMFWDSIPRLVRQIEKVEVVFKPNRRMVWVGDAVASTGFAKGTHKILETLRKDWDVHVLGLNYYGDPHDYPYNIYPAQNGGDMFGVRRLPWLLEKVRPELVVIQNDPWNFPMYFKSTGNVPVVGIVAVDGLNCRGEELNGLQHAIFWTEFGANEAARGGYRGPSSVIPLGVDLDLYKPLDRTESQKAMGIHQYVQNAFVVGNVNRNQPRKRLDLTIQYFCEWVKSYRISDAFLYLHVAPTGEQGYDAKQLMRYYGVSGRLILSVTEILYGIKESSMPYVYNSFDVQISTTQGEGFGLTTLEGAACGTPQIVPGWSALGELFKDCADLIPCTTTSATPNNINVIGGVPDKDAFIGALNRLYKNQMYRIQKSSDCIHTARDPKFQWGAIGEQYRNVLNGVFSQEAVNA